MTIPQRKYRQLHGAMVLICKLRKVGRLGGHAVNETVVSQPIFKLFDEIYEEIPILQDKADVMRFASRCKAHSLTWQASMRAMEKAMHGSAQLAVQEMVYDLKHHSTDLRAQLHQHLEGKLDPQTAAPLFDLFEAIESGSSETEKMAEHDEHSGNRLCEIRHEGGVAALKARDKKAVDARVASDPVYVKQLEIEKLWRQALRKPGAYGGKKTQFVREMQKVAEPFVIPGRRITDWTSVWGGKLIKAKAPVTKKITRRPGLSETLCVRHSMTTRSMNATQDENDRSGGQGGAAEILSRAA